jgi:excisionase family DNA binding protein
MSAYEHYLNETGHPAAAGALALASTIEAQQQALTVDDVARMLRISPRQVYRLCEANRLKHVRIGGRGLRFSREAVREFLAGGER